MEKTDGLTDFLNWALQNLTIIGMVPYKNPVWKIQDVTSTLLYRDPPYQIQMFSVPGGTVIPQHTHPNVDSYEVYLGGNINFSHKGKYVFKEEELKEEENFKTSVARGGILRVRPDEEHGGVFGKEGGVFLSVQKWLNGVEPHCVAADYVGVVMGEDHYKKVKFGQPVLKQHLSESDVINNSNFTEPHLGFDGD
jgi:hypothetical protein